MTIRRVLLFVRVFVLVAFASAFMLAVVTTALDNRHLTAQNDQLIAQIEREHAEQATERRALIEGQRDLQRKYDGLLRTNKALLVYLRTHGYYIPPDLIPSENADSSTVHSDGPRGSSKSGSTGTAAKSGSTAGSGSGSKSGGGSAKGHGAKGGHSHGGGSGKGSGHSKAGHSKGHRSK